MGRWHRIAPLSDSDENPRKESWIYKSLDGGPRSFDLDVTVGKPFDVLGVKGFDLDEVNSYSNFLSGVASELYGPGSQAEIVRHCPICGASLAGAREELHVFNVAYVRCHDCRHVVVDHYPSGDVLDKLFADSETHSSAYTDPDMLESRISQIISPKLNWVLDCYHRAYGLIPRRVIDVGAGGGHFLEGARRGGFDVEGFEKSRVSRGFALETFGLHLRDDDFLTADIESADIVTFWGLLEYLTDPRRFLARAREILGPQGMLIVEVPRVDALGTLVQSREGAVVARHMDPTTHVNGFSDESLATALVEERFAPVAAWYFGMDAYETLVQCAFMLGKCSDAEKIAEFIPCLQKAADRGRQCDDIVVAAVPLA